MNGIEFWESKNTTTARLMKPISMNWGTWKRGEYGLKLEWMERFIRNCPAWAFVLRLGQDQWEWVDEALTESYKSTEYKPITGKDEKHPMYAEERQNFNTLLEALAINRGRDSGEMKEDFYGIRFGEYPLAKIRELIPAQFTSAKDFIAITDAPHKIFTEYSSAVYKQLAKEISEGRAGTELQNLLLHESEEHMEMYRQLEAIRKKFAGLDEQNPDPEQFDHIVDGLVEIGVRYPGLRQAAQLDKKLLMGYGPRDNLNVMLALKTIDKNLPRAIYVKNHAAAFGFGGSGDRDRTRDPEFLAWNLQQQLERGSGT